MMPSKRGLRFKVEPKTLGSLHLVPAFKFFATDNPANFVQGDPTYGVAIKGQNVATDRPTHKNSLLALDELVARA